MATVWDCRTKLNIGAECPSYQPRETKMIDQLNVLLGRLHWLGVAVIWIKLRSNTANVNSMNGVTCMAYLETFCPFAFHSQQLEILFC
jgi:hypothetical protein